MLNETGYKGGPKNQFKNEVITNPYKYVIRVIATATPIYFRPLKGVISPFIAVFLGTTL